MDKVEIVTENIVQLDPVNDLLLSGQDIWLRSFMCVRLPRFRGFPFHFLHKLIECYINDFLFLTFLPRAKWLNTVPLYHRIWTDSFQIWNIDTRQVQDAYCILHTAYCILNQNFKYLSNYTWKQLQNLTT